jgi:predicted Zn-dependent protease
MKIQYLLLSSLLLLSAGSCQWVKKTFSGAGNALDNINAFPYTEDIKLGEQISQEIAANQKDYPVLSKTQYASVYSYMESLKRVILQSGELKYKDEFAWELTLINKPEVQNAFATPGGYIYIYTGLIKFLDSEDQLLGVLGHEMAHADQRHSTRQLTKSYGVALLLDVILGERDAIEEIMGAVVGLRFSRGHETEADEYSVAYLCDTDYNAAGSAGFFKKIKDAPAPPEFISTHPSSASRVEDIESHAQELGCVGKLTNKQRYEQIKAKL